jgi:hypothetical protein
MAIHAEARRQGGHYVTEARLYVFPLIDIYVICYILRIYDTYTSLLNRRTVASN